LITKRFIKSSIIYTLAGALPMASAIILLPVYTRFLSAEVYGALSIYLVFSVLIQVVVTYGFDSSLFTYFHELKNDPKKLSSFISSAFIFILIIGIGVGFVITAAGEWVFAKAFAGQKISFFPYGLLSLVTGVAQSLFKVNNSLLQTQGKAENFFWSNLLSFSLIASLTVAGLYFYPDTLVGPVGGRLLAALISGSWVLVNIYRQFGFQFDFKLLRSSFDFNNSVLVYQLQQWLITYADRFVILFFLPLSEVGIYDFAVKCLLVMEFILTGFSNSFLPKVVGMIVAQEKKGTTVEINRYYNGLTALTILMVPVCILGFPVLIPLLISKPVYLMTIPLFPFIALTYLLRAARLYFAMPYTATKYTKPLPFYYLAIASIKIGSLLLLIRYLGIYGVIGATWLSYMTEIGILYFGIRTRFTLRFNALKILAGPFVVSLLIIVLEPWLAGAHPFLVHSSYLLFTLLMLVWVYRIELKAIDFSKVLR